jgi:hypothetical protein
LKEKVKQAEIESGDFERPDPAFLARDDVDVIDLLRGEKIGHQVHGLVLGFLGVEGMALAEQATAQPEAPHEAVALSGSPIRSGISWPAPRAAYSQWVNVTAASLSV